ncbi:MAG: helix-turn-helix transcriptional regulator [Lachnospiraceae bacterium]|nr:helix-turn-helix transcriptional regulator [Lachnospiraceae bacterium]
MKTLNEILRDLREDHDMKQETIAKYLGISQQAYSNYENGHREIPVTAVKSLAQLYKVSTDYLLRSDTNYTGSLDVNNIYVDGVTMRDIIVDMQTLKDTERKDLVKYIQFLCQDEKQGGRQR